MNRTLLRILAAICAFGLAALTLTMRPSPPPAAADSAAAPDLPAARGKYNEICGIYVTNASAMSFSP